VTKIRGAGKKRANSWQPKKKKKTKKKKTIRRAKMEEGKVRDLPSAIHNVLNKEEEKKS